MTARTLARLGERIRRIDFPHVIPLAIAFVGLTAFISIDGYNLGVQRRLKERDAQVVRSERQRRLNRYCAIEGIVKDPDSHERGQIELLIKQTAVDEIGAILRGERDARIRNACKQ